MNQRSTNNGTTELTPSSTLARLEDRHAKRSAEVERLQRELQKAQVEVRVLAELIAMEIAGKRSEDGAGQPGRRGPKRGRPRSESGTKTVIEVADRLLREAAHPLKRKTIVSRMQAEGHFLESVSPAGLVSKILGGSDLFCHIPGQGYWVSDKPWPPQEQPDGAAST